ncbi:MAG: helix-turn-helix domain-containing protein [Hamadaea sp.]|nr:helix-turn-helix domain-containing protein [Hamadaea sp.]NUS43221.1 helix-turn-helix domain-containing protein [Mycobacteriaceae bacterium]
MPNRSDDEELTIKEVMAKLKVTRSTFYDWRAKGIAPKSYRLPNGERRIRRSELDRWLESLEDAA